MALNLQHQTGAQFLSRLREAFRGAGKERCAKLAKFILDRIEAGDVTETQVRNAFGLTVTQWNTLKTKLTNLRNSYNLIQAAEGE